MIQSPYYTPGDVCLATGATYRSLQYMDMKSKVIRPTGHTSWMHRRYSAVDALLVWFWVRVRARRHHSSRYKSGKYRPLWSLAQCKDMLLQLRFRLSECKTPLEGIGVLVAVPKARVFLAAGALTMSPQWQDDYVVLNAHEMVGRLREAAKRPWRRRAKL